MNIQRTDVSDSEAWSFSFCGLSRPTFVGLPHVILRTDGAVIQKIKETTGSLPGPWPLQPIYRESGELFLEEYMPFSAWAFAPNQARLPDICRGGDDVDLFVDCTADESILKKFCAEAVWPGVRQLVMHSRWIAVPTPECVFVVFICAKENEEWCLELTSWANDTGRKWGHFALSLDRLVFEGTMAREPVDPRWRTTVGLVSQGVLDPSQWPISADKMDSFKE